MTKKIAVLPGDGIGPEIVAEAVKVLHSLRDEHGLKVELEQGLVGGAGYDAHGTSLPDETLALARAADAILLGAVGGPKWEPLEIALRPEKGLLGLRAELELFSNLRPAILYKQLAEASTLKPEVVAGLDIMIVRELTGGIYFGQPRGIRTLENGERQGFNTLVYSESEVRRIGRSAFEIAMKRNKRVCSVDKANVLECTELWREVMIEVSQDYPEVELSHMYVDNAAMQLVRAPKQFDVMVTTNMFGDILSDCASMLTGSIGMLPSASLDINGKNGNTQNSKAGLGGRAQWYAENGTRFAVLNYEYGESSDVKDTDKTFLHFRNIGYLENRLNGGYSRGFAWEAFAQLENNKFTRLSLRALLGAGVRDRKSVV